MKRVRGLPALVLIIVKIYSLLLRICFEVYKMIKMQPQISTLNWTRQGSPKPLHSPDENRTRAFLVTKKQLEIWVCMGILFLLIGKTSNPSHIATRIHILHILHYNRFGHRVHSHRARSHSIRSVVFLLFSAIIIIIFLLFVNYAPRGGEDLMRRLWNS